MRAVEVLRSALMSMVEEMGLSWPVKAVIEPPRDARHGDLAVNVAMLLAKEAGKNPRELAQAFAAGLPERCADILKAEVAGPGFINVTFSPDFWRQTVLDIEAAGADYGRSPVGAGRRTLVEYVSANPTGPLHVGHGRGAAVGDSLARLLRRAGFAVDTEYYINDAGLQMRLLGLSVWLRVQELKGRPVEWPESYYRGEYIIDIAREMLAEDDGLADLPEDEGKERCYERAMRDILNGIKQDLADFRVEHQQWFSEKTLVEGGKVAEAFAALDEAGYTYHKDDAYWFATEKLGDDKDRVLRKSDGTLTYFASDIAYHHDKYRRGYQWLIDIWGADHHGYVPRMRAAIAAMGQPRESFDVVLIQLVNLLQNGQPVSMSTRAGTFETLADVIKEVGTDAARFMFLSRKSDSPLDFDLELAKQRSLDNPVYYVQYAHARICAVLRRAEERGMHLPGRCEPALLAALDTPEDMALLRKAAGMEDMIANAALTLSVHHVSHYLMDLAGMLHSYYAKHQVLDAGDGGRSLARLALLRAVGQVLRNGLDILGVSAPETM
ncbi:arginine--tRNA ligase [uncultured Desulfovibrio sp.]|uniref:arginine--tRNA ligase n=1 Tax=uncultured Desulfovibrio sp. TaxID=167968 RepID=UPI00261E10AD|nr:arginine--tRNA ligase [uncultured Desulfovibrio sp.]